MKDFVSRHWISVVALVAALSVFCIVLGPAGFPWRGLGWVGLVLSAAVSLARMRSNLPITQVIHDVETEPRLKREGTP